MICVSAGVCQHAPLSVKILRVCESYNCLDRDPGHRSRYQNSPNTFIQASVSHCGIFLLYHVEFMDRIIASNSQSDKKECYSQTEVIYRQKIILTV